MDEPLPELARELFGLAYAQLVERRAKRAWQASRSTDFLDLVERVCADNDIELLGGDLADRLMDAFDEPYDRYLLRISLAASALWKAGKEITLLAALDGPATPQPATRPAGTKRSRRLVQRRPRKRTDGVREPPRQAPGTAPTP